MSIACSKCRRELQDPEPLARISRLMMGDEYTEYYYRCATCGFYTIVSYHDAFQSVDEEERRVLPPLPPDVGEAHVKLIRTCPNPHDKFCDCEAHQALSRL